MLPSHALSVCRLHLPFAALCIGTCPLHAPVLRLFISAAVTSVQSYHHASVAYIFD